jgi:hypothetical protein
VCDGVPFSCLESLAKKKPAEKKVPDLFFASLILGPSTKLVRVSSTFWHFFPQNFLLKPGEENSERHKCVCDVPTQKRGSIDSVAFPGMKCL